MKNTPGLPKLGFLYLNHVLRFFDNSNFKGWPDKIAQVTYRWGKDKQRFIDEVKAKKINVLIGNIPATAYETFREIAKALPEVEFVPSLDAQFSNKSKENVTHFCNKYNLPAPNTSIFYVPDRADKYLKNAVYPKIIKRSFGPSNYGGYFVHKVDNYTQAKMLLNKRKYYPVYVQDFVPMEADIRVMLIGHKPVCAFWRRPPEGEWLTNTSQGGSMDYENVPKNILKLAVETSKAANAEYWACDIALGKNGQIYILECATAFAAFPYIRDWIGQYLMWKYSSGQFKLPNIPMWNWEELGKINVTLLRTMRHITFGKHIPSYDSNELFKQLDEYGFPVMEVQNKPYEEWPSSIWNFQDNFQLNHPDLYCEPDPIEISKDESCEPLVVEEHDDSTVISQLSLMTFFTGIKGIGNKMAQDIINTLGTQGVIDALQNNPNKLCEIKNVKAKKLEMITSHWQQFSQTL
ncbi:ATP-grasp domain-containing protein [Pseudoalteromonas denitrificans]|uniref:RimK-like ATP-grasp domain-containing protein n=1 Tax=Pseudoalteromonas denitrificans DSM 6059 TaxID=1123010 RepID=A0A1I1KIC2_9GAMM|nr:hypothetical protein [Pseudoalteromonas denitrificans]SFC60557.1 RimK-like ATP-grasp domain-containing protein [Pseudoalteromonas denitrificans DSM 6059]